MNSTRIRLLSHLGVKQIATSTELSRALQVTPADARYHLSSLLNEGLIQIIGERQPEGPGRPARVYSLSHKHKEDNIILLIEVLLNEISEGKSTSEQSIKMQSIAEKIIGAEYPTGKLSQLLYIAVNRLNELNYHARWEAHPDAPQLILGNCPYSVIIDRHPEICLIDKYIIERLLETTVTQETKLLRDERGYSSCIFRTGR